MERAFQTYLCKPILWDLSETINRVQQRGLTGHLSNGDKACLILALRPRVALQIPPSRDVRVQGKEAGDPSSYILPHNYSYVSDNMQQDFLTFPSLPDRYYYCPHFMVEETESSRGQQLVSSEFGI